MFIFKNLMPPLDFLAVSFSRRRHIAAGLAMTLAVNFCAFASEPDPVSEPPPLPAPTAAKTAQPFIQKTADGKTTISINTAAAPDLTGWADHTLAPVLADWYPKIAAMLPSTNFIPPTNFTVTIRPMDGVAFTAGTRIEVSADWCRSQLHNEAVGSVVHELVHVVQQYGRHGYAHNPGWLVEGIADYIRWFKYEPQSHGADQVWMLKQGRNFTPHYDDGYRVTANFLNWVSEKYDRQIAAQMNAAMREGNYHHDLWKTCTGKSLADLGVEWQKIVEARTNSNSAAN